MHVSNLIWTWETEISEFFPSKCIAWKWLAWEQWPMHSLEFSRNGEDHNWEQKAQSAFHKTLEQARILYLQIQNNSMDYINSS